MLVIKNISKIYRQKFYELKALDEINISFNRGEFVAIVGKSGCGKTTLLNIIAGLIRPTAGAILFEGDDITSKQPKEILKFRKEHVGIILQNFSLLNDRNVYANVELPLKIQRVSKSKRKALVNKYLSMVDMSDKINAYPRQLSGGQKQRVAIARALISDADIILADEPTGSLDEKNAEQIVSILREIANLGKIVIMVTHNMAATSKCDRCITIDRGNIIHDEVKK